MRFEQDRQGRVRERKSNHPDDEIANSDWTPISNWRWSLRVHSFPEIANKPWFVGQILAGPICLAAARVSTTAAHTPIVTPHGSEPGLPRSHARIGEIGTLYTAVAGMLNLLAIIDSAYRAGQGAR